MRGSWRVRPLTTSSLCPRDTDSRACLCMSFGPDGSSQQLAQGQQRRPHGAARLHPALESPSSTCTSQPWTGLSARPLLRVVCSTLSKWPMCTSQLHEIWQSTRRSSRSVRRLRTPLLRWPLLLPPTVWTRRVSFCHGTRILQRASLTRGHTRSKGRIQIPVSTPSPLPRRGRGGVRPAFLPSRPSWM